ncbi:hypothetical protein AC578_8075 [Pseudocercospora eumusae]|uniref:Uncharacterized protein n=1 Tax=Pseudocercospora eumusae TaxID=321146 RepID=A0A139H7J7_9PEZI|nr:hypothetical protein AC578_8075 [Pseudocercospora eumusae]
MTMRVEERLREEREDALEGQWQSCVGGGLVPRDEVLMVKRCSCDGWARRCHDVLLRLRCEKAGCRLGGTAPAQDRSKDILLTTLRTCTATWDTSQALFPPYPAASFRLNLVRRRQHI